MTSYIDFWVDGDPIAQGSMITVGEGRMRHSNSGLGAWRDAIGWGWKGQYRGDTLPRGSQLRMDLTFFVPRTDTAAKQGRVVPAVRGEGGDLDKLVRGVLDALEGLAYEDDAQVVHVDALKLYNVSQPQRACGVRVRLARFTFGPPPWPERWAQLR